VATALYPGSFDPFHLGHLDVVEQAARIFDEVIIGVLDNPRKPSGLFAIPERVQLASAATAHLPNVRCTHSDKLTIDVARSEGAAFVIRSGHKEGRHEVTMATMNQHMSGIQTLFVVADPTRRLTSASLVRDLVSRGETLAAARLVPPNVGQALLNLVGVSTSS
jgi:pantetheine-phosphate adenylyltransferase